MTELAAKRRTKTVPAKRGQKRSSSTTRPARATAKTKSKNKPAGARSAAGQKRVPARKKGVLNFRCHAKKEISGAFSEIVHTLIEEAKGGSVNHTKLLFDLGGVKEQAKGQARHKEKEAELPSLGEMLLEELERHLEQPEEQVGTGTENLAETAGKEEVETLPSEPDTDS